MMLVYRLPGPRTIMSASAMADRAAGSALGWSGSSRTWRMRQSSFFLQ